MIPLPGLTEQPLTTIEKVISAALEGILSLSSSLLCDSQKKPHIWVVLVWGKDRSEIISDVFPTSYHTTDILFNTNNALN